MKDDKQADSNMTYMPIGMCIGIGIGTAIGAATDNIGIGMSIGLSIGMSIGIIIDASNRKKAKDAKNTDSEKSE